MNSNNNEGLESNINFESNMNSNNNDALESDNIVSSGKSINIDSGLPQPVTKMEIMRPELESDSSITSFISHNQLSSMSDTDVASLIKGIVQEKARLDNQRKALSIMQEANSGLRNLSGSPEISGGNSSDYNDIFHRGGNEFDSKPDLFTEIKKGFCNYFNITRK